MEEVVADVVAPEDLKVIIYLRDNLERWFRSYVKL